MGGGVSARDGSVSPPPAGAPGAGGFTTNYGGPAASTRQPEYQQSRMNGTFPGGHQVQQGPPGGFSNQGPPGPPPAPQLYAMRGHDPRLISPPLAVLREIEKGHELLKGLSLIHI